MRFSRVIHLLLIISSTVLSLLGTFSPSTKRVEWLAESLRSCTKVFFPFDVKSINGNFEFEVFESKALRHTYRTSSYFIVFTIFLQIFTFFRVFALKSENFEIANDRTPPQWAEMCFLSRFSKSDYVSVAVDRLEIAIRGNKYFLRRIVYGSGSKSYEFLHITSRTSRKKKSFWDFTGLSTHNKSKPEAESKKTQR